MAFNTLERIFEVERHHRRSSAKGGFATPIVEERAVDGHGAPFFVTNTKGLWVQTRIIAPNLIRCGLFPCTLENEGIILRRLYATILQFSPDSRCTSVRKPWTGWGLRVWSLEP